MHNIYFYKDKKGKQPVLEYLKFLKNKKDKDSRIKLNKINDYIQMLSIYGTQIGEPYVKHLENNIWELRPLRDRIFFVGWIDGSYILLHYFIKKTQKTPVREIKQAKKELADLIERSKKNEQ